MRSFGAKSPAVAFHAGRSVDQIIATIPEQNIGLKIRALRRAAGMSLREISECVGISFVQFHRYEMGVSQLSTSRLLTISHVLGVPVAHLLSEPVLAEPEHLARERRQERMELSRLFAALTDPAGRRAVLVFARAAMAREKVLHAHANSLPAVEAEVFTLACKEIEQ